MKDDRSYVAVRPCGCWSGFASKDLSQEELDEIFRDWLERGDSIEQQPIEEIRRRAAWKCEEHGP